MIRSDIINHLIEKYNYQTYLEIGLGDGRNYLRINCRHKECVDPYEGDFDRNYSVDVNEFIREHILTYQMTSDEFFETEGRDKKYDLIFIDGLHMEEQVDRDILNSLRHLNEGGRVVVHDCLPFSKEAQLPVEERIDGNWNGTVWKSIPKLALMGIEYFVVDTDFGCGIIEYHPNADKLELPPPADYEYDDVFKSEITKRIMLRIITPETFMNIFDGRILSVR